MVEKMAKGKYPKGGGKGLSGDALVGKVSQKTIDDIKRLGMTKALELAGRNGKTAGGAAREFQEGVRRMYGARRLAEAKAKYAPATRPKGPATSGPMSANTPAKRSSASSGPRSANTPVNKSKKSNSLGAKVAGGAAAAGLLIASRGKATGAVAKLAPGLAKSSVGKALFGTGKAPVFKNPIVDKATAGVKAGAKQPKVPGTRMEYAAKLAQDKASKEMTALAAKKKAAAAAAAKTAAKAPAKAPVKSSMSTKKKIGLTGAGGGSLGLSGDSRKKR